MILEGGSIETDGKGLILTTSACLLNSNRSHMEKPREKHLVEQVLSRALGATRFVWLEHGHLEGDDTDAHIDTLVRFVDAKTVVYVQCENRSDSHYPALAAMEQELQQHAQQQGWTLIPLPMAPAIHDEQGERLPATYANFLITNHSILVPVYDETTDAAALAALGKVAGTRKVVGIDCRSLIHQHGSLHCVTMQLPAGCR
jgi:agmatine/peptidylarginine deiminase